MPSRTIEERRANVRRHYARNSAKVRAKVAEYKRKIRRDRKAAMDAHKGSRCARCGGTFPPHAMDLAHVDRAEKHHRMRRSGGARDWYALPEADFYRELAKTVGLCSNCHRIETAEENAAGVQEALELDTSPQLRLFG